MEKNIGVYKIQNNINGKLYVGSSIHLNKRMRDHSTMLKANKHENNYLQNAYNKYGKENFTIKVIEFASSKKEVRKIEQHIIDSLDLCNPKNGYNLNGSANGGCIGGKSAHNYGNIGFKNPLSSQVAQIDCKTKNIIKIWGSLREVKKHININITHISNVCTFFNETHLLKISKGYCWCFKEDTEKLITSDIFTFKDRKQILDHSKKANYGVNNGMAKKVVQLTLDNEYLKTYNTIKEASEDNNINTQIIYNHLFRKPANPRDGFRWMYIEDYQALTE